MIRYVVRSLAVALSAAALVLSGAARTEGDGDPAGQEADAAGTAVVRSATTAPRTTVRIGVFGLFRPRELVVRPAAGRVLVVWAGTEPLKLEGAEQARLRIVEGAEGASLECATSHRTVRAPVVHVSGFPQDPGGSGFVLSVPGKIERRFRGTLVVSAGKPQLEAPDAGGNVLVAIVTMDFETAVASVVAAESPPGAPLEALKAQAVATRSYYVAARGRHRGFDFCDTTHCQFLRSPPASNDPAWVAAAATRGLILTYRGAPLTALYSASCGGRTRTLAEVGMRPDGERGGYPYFAVDCPYCSLHARTWICRIRQDGLGDGDLLRAGVSSEAARLRFARKAGWSALPGNDYDIRSEGGALVAHGRGAGHGVGMCQEGARGMAEAGADFREILMHYYPNTRLATTGE
jgi:stage II sporulation protein D (peptidoglycan lytic transglycosylase)